jgi:hypothetical protein
MGTRTYTVLDQTNGRILGLCVEEEDVCRSCDGVVGDDEDYPDWVESVRCSCAK